jgi:DNA repair exonuclease SbcCD ATPase subunit
MITGVHLANWMAYRDFELKLETGTTFLVASNGVGKTSFIDAVQWALNCDALAHRRLIRRGSKNASVEVRLRAGDTPVRIKRTLTAGRGRTPSMSVDAWVDEVSRDPDDAFKLLADAWKADNRFASKAAFLSDRLLYGDSDPDLRAHLIRLHALDHVQDAIELLRPAINTATDIADGVRNSAQASRDQLEVTDAEVEATTAALEQQRVHEAEARQAAKAAASQAEVGRIAKAARDALQRWREENAALVTDTERILGAAVPDEIPLVSFLRSSEAAARRQLLEQTELQARLVERISAMNESLAKLRAADGECPVCRRPLDADSRGFAEQLHRHDQEAATDELSVVDVDAAETLAARLRDVLQRAENLGPPPEIPATEPTDLEQLEAAATQAGDVLEVVLADVREAQLRAADARAARDLLQEPDQADLAARLYAKVAALEAARDAMTATVSEVLERQLGPVRDEVNRRWDLVFPDRPGIRLDADGHITRTFADDDGDLEFVSFSSGEKVIAKLLLRLATLTKTTGMPFCWIDEPLEHLDPEARVFVAQTLAHLSGSGSLHQIFVTTYETQLARELVAEADEQVHLEMLRGTPAQS